jgi:hypothetical protein
LDCGLDYCPDQRPVTALPYQEIGFFAGFFGAVLCPSLLVDSGLNGR